MKKKIGYSFLILGIVVVCLTLGIYLGFRYTRNEKNVEISSNISKDKGEIIEDTTPVSTKTYDIEVIYKDEYTKCGHIIESKDIKYGTTIDKIKEENKKQKEIGIIYELTEENNDSITYYRKIDQNCPNHFFVKIEDNKINIYNIIDESAMTVYKKLDVDINTLNPEMLEELNEGIKANSKEDLNLIIEDIES